MCQLWLQSSQVLDREEPSSKFNHMIIILLLVGFSFSRYVGPRASVTPPAFEQKFYGMWASPYGSYHETHFIRAASRKSPKVSASQMEVAVVYSIVLELTAHHFKKKKTKLQLYSDFNNISTQDPIQGCHVSLVSLICNHSSVFPCFS